MPWPFRTLRRASSSSELQTMEDRQLDIEQIDLHEQHLRQRLSRLREARLRNDEEERLERVQQQRQQSQPGEDSVEGSTSEDGLGQESPTGNSLSLRHSRSTPNIPPLESFDHTIQVPDVPNIPRQYTEREDEVTREASLYGGSSREVEPVVYAARHNLLPSPALQPVSPAPAANATTPTTIRRKPVPDRSQAAPFLPSDNRSAPTPFGAPNSRARLQKPARMAPAGRPPVSEPNLTALPTAANTSTSFNFRRFVPSRPRGVSIARLSRVLRGNERGRTPSTAAATATSGADITIGHPTDVRHMPVPDEIQKWLPSLPAAVERKGEEEEGREVREEGEEEEGGRGMAGHPMADRPWFWAGEGVPAFTQDPSIPPGLANMSGHVGWHGMNGGRFNPLRAHGGVMDFASPPAPTTVAHPSTGPSSSPPPAPTSPWSPRSSSLNWSGSPRSTTTLRPQEEDNVSASGTSSIVRGRNLLAEDDVFSGEARSSAETPLGYRAGDREVPVLARAPAIAIRRYRAEDVVEGNGSAGRSARRRQRQRQRELLPEGQE
ncbi:hypothetical protein K490DRAFT_67269 [Saccharata proteae CBS 121410]|uniref:Uncharacterized protein n=1 Tax=Saccharata proteae CBS 121410 TaxID=1314787 RepID=A0A9P4HSP4_9PEZI|nr:hypothetical protein K490DRAFT_67269 [Saccharata proteae CBS 121410]